ncbi:unannotated protein [freshwater metagenome]|uniref:Unannotated protein n=1 Tax=freshwater metagenome TaxID=449393 RepID=A0A6J7K5U9_9ZZZZ|nr:hypothetical protein [Actinomycetota bacterium]
MSLTVELTGTGLIWRNGVGQQTAGIVAVCGVGEGVLVLRGNLPAETTLTVEQWQHLSRVAAEVATNAKLSARVEDAEPIVPRRPEPNAAYPPMG